jgi:hypothetical protein
MDRFILAGLETIRANGATEAATIAASLSTTFGWASLGPRLLGRRDTIGARSPKVDLDAFIQVRFKFILSVFLSSCCCPFQFALIRGYCCWFDELGYSCLHDFISIHPTAGRLTTSLHGPTGESGCRYMALYFQGTDCPAAPKRNRITARKVPFTIARLRDGVLGETPVSPDFPTVLPLII